MSFVKNINCANAQWDSFHNLNIDNFHVATLSGITQKKYLELQNHCSSKKLQSLPLVSFKNQEGLTIVYNPEKINIIACNIYVSMNKNILCDARMNFQCENKEDKSMFKTVITCSKDCLESDYTKGGLRLFNQILKITPTDTSFTFEFNNTLRDVDMIYNPKKVRLTVCDLFVLMNGKELQEERTIDGFRNKPNDDASKNIIISPKKYSKYDLSKGELQSFKSTQKINRKNNPTTPELIAPELNNTQPKYYSEIDLSKKDIKEPSAIPAIILVNSNPTFKLNDIQTQDQFELDLSKRAIKPVVIPEIILVKSAPTSELNNTHSEPVPSEKNGKESESTLEITPVNNTPTIEFNGPIDEQYLITSKVDLVKKSKEEALKLDVFLDLCREKFQSIDLQNIAIIEGTNNFYAIKTEVLTRESPVFSEMLKSSSIDIKKMTSPIKRKNLDVFIKCLHSKTPSEFLDKKNVIDVIDLSKHYKTERIKKACLQFLSDN